MLINTADILPKKNPYYECLDCRFNCHNKKDYSRHILTRKHNILQNTATILPKKNPCYECLDCRFNCHNKKDYSRHILTRKHNILQNTPQKNPKNPSFVCICGKKYLHRQSLSNHKKKCTFDEKVEENPILIEVTKEHNTFTNSELVDFLLKENNVFKKLLIEQQNTMLQLVNKPSTINNTNNTNNTHNNQFNINVFLNEKCKDAMNITDFVTSLKLTLQDLEKTGELGYVKGITNIILNGLNELDVYKRPIHCSDLKRETLYIKDKDVWEKENESKKKIKNAIKHISSINAKQVTTWTELNKGFDDYSSKKNDKYMKIVSEANGGEDEEINKIIKNIAPNIIINKQSTICGLHI